MWKSPILRLQMPLLTHFSDSVSLDLYVGRKQTAQFKSSNLENPRKLSKRIGVFNCLWTSANLCSVICREFIPFVFFNINILKMILYWVLHYIKVLVKYEHLSRTALGGSLRKNTANKKLYYNVISKLFIWQNQSLNKVPIWDEIWMLRCIIVYIIHLNIQSSGSEYYRSRVRGFSVGHGQNASVACTRP